MIPPLAPGALLVAAPSMTDPNFAGTVVLLCAVEAGGSVGLVLNRPMNVAVSELLPVEPGKAGAAPEVTWGGPVGLKQVFLLHEAPCSAEIGQRITGGIHFGGGLDGARRVIEQGGRLRFFAGYAGWDRGQLEQEREDGGWLVLPPDEQEIWTDERALQWERLAARADPSLGWMLQIRHPETN